MQLVLNIIFTCLIITIGLGSYNWVINMNDHIYSKLGNLILITPFIVAIITGIYCLWFL